MRRQRNMAQMKGETKTPEKELSKMEISNLSDAQFKSLVIRILQELTGYLNGIKKTQEEMKVALTEIKIYREPTMKGMKVRIKSKTWNIKKKKTFNQKRKKKKELKKK